MKDLMKYPLEIQLFADDGGDGDTPPITKPIEPKVDMVEKKALDKPLKEKAELQRQLKAKMSEEEKAKKAQEEKEAELQELQNFKKASILQNELLKEKVDPSDVTKISEAILSNDVETIAKAINEAIKNATTEAVKEANREALNQTPLPNGSTTQKETTVEDFKKMTLDERIEFKINNPELYEKLKSA